MMKWLLSIIIGVALIVGGIMLMKDFILQFLRFGIGLVLFLLGLGLVLGGYTFSRFSIRR